MPAHQQRTLQRTSNKSSTPPNALDFYLYDYYFTAQTSWSRWSSRIVGPTGNHLPHQWNTFHFNILWRTGQTIGDVQRSDISWVSRVLCPTPYIIRPLRRLIHEAEHLRFQVHKITSSYDEAGCRPADEACICHRQILLSDWHVPTAVAEVPRDPVPALRLTLHHGEAMRNLHILRVTKVTYVLAEKAVTQCTIQFNISMNQWKCVALDEASSPKKDWFCAGYLASSSHVSKEVRSSVILLSRVKCSCLGVFSRTPGGSNSIQFTSAYLLIRPIRYVPKQWDVDTLQTDGGGKWRLCGYVTDNSISYKVMPLNTQDLPQAPLVQCINSLHVAHNKQNMRTTRLTTAILTVAVSN